MAVSPMTSTRMATIATPRMTPKATPRARSVPERPVFSTRVEMRKFARPPTIRVTMNRQTAAATQRTVGLSRASGIKMASLAANARATQNASTQLVSEIASLTKPRTMLMRPETTTMARMIQSRPFKAVHPRRLRFSLRARSREQPHG
jgi:hypothetical protein